MSLTLDVLRLFVDGKLSKDATIKALAMNKEGKLKVADLDWKSLAAITGAQVGIPLAINAVGSGISKLVSGRSQASNNALFQKIMMQHPSLQGKDPQRAKANFDYIMAEAPHLADHPLILGDHVANMTSLGSTDPATLKMLADTSKARRESTGKAEEFVPGLSSAAETFAKAKMQDLLNRPPTPAEQTAAYQSDLMSNYQARKGFLGADDAEKPQRQEFLDANRPKPPQTKLHKKP